MHSPEEHSNDISNSLLRAAQEAAQHAYAPYSHFPVGAAILLADGEVVTGTNVENASFGLSICAERVAVFNAISAGKTAIKSIALWANKNPYGSVTPCGACRQVLAEFLKSDSLVLYRDSETGKIIQMSMAQLLPMAFDFPRKDNTEPDARQPIA